MPREQLVQVAGIANHSSREVNGDCVPLGAQAPGDGDGPVHAVASR
jgi:hypothetical protein